MTDWHVPDRGLVGSAAVLGGLVALWFGLVYGGADYLTSLRTLRVRVHFDWELGVPFVPAAVLGYLSIYPLLWLAPFRLRGDGELRALAATLAAVIAAGGACFLLAPAQVAYPDPPAAGSLGPLVLFARAAALRYNLLPSLHVALAAACVSVYSVGAGPRTLLVLRLWLALLAASTLLLHQHHLLDVAAGLVLGLAAGRRLYPVLMTRSVLPASARTALPSRSMNP